MPWSWPKEVAASPSARGSEPMWPEPADAKLTSGPWKLVRRQRHGLPRRPVNDALGELNESLNVDCQMEARSAAQRLAHDLLGGWLLDVYHRRTRFKTFTGSRFSARQIMIRSLSSIFLRPLSMFAMTFRLTPTNLASSS